MMSNKMFDYIKWFALVFVPALEVLILTVGKIWDAAYYVEIAQTVAACGVFLAALLGYSNQKYYKSLGEHEADDPEEME